MLPGDTLVARQLIRCSAAPRSGRTFVSRPDCEIIRFAVFESDFQNRDDGCAFDDDVAGFESNMNIEKLHIGMKVRHPQYGVGVVRSLTEPIAEIAIETNRGKLHRPLPISNRRKQPLQ